MSDAVTDEQLAEKARETWEEALPDHVRGMLPELDESDREWMEYATTATRFAQLQGRSEIEVNGLRANTVFCLAALSMFKQMAPEGSDPDHQTLATIALVRGIGMSVGLIASQFVDIEMTEERGAELIGLLRDELLAPFESVVTETIRQHREESANA